MTLTPTRIDPLTSTEISLEWNTGERYAVPYKEIRFHCPCAACVDEHTGQRTIKRESVPEDIKPVAVQLVGRYAVQINWSDRHATGMYHFERLHELCQKFGRKL